jgi:hypothetical protein
MTLESLPNVLLLTVAVIVVALVVSTTGADADLWGHVRFGLDILAERSIPRHDVYSFTSDIPWTNHEWLAEVAMAGAYRSGGAAGLVGLKVAVAVGALAALWSTLLKAGVFRPQAVGLLLVAVLGSSTLLMTLRPQVFSALLFASLLAVLVRASLGRPALLAWLPALFAVWANIHGGWIVGGGVLLVWAAGALVTGTVPRRWLVVGVAGMAATAVNPYGVGLWRFLWETVGLGRSDIVEWQPLHRAPLFLVLWAMAALLVAAALYRRGKSAVVHALPVVVLAVLALRVARLEGFFAIAAAMLLSPCFAGLGPRRLPLSRMPTRAEAVVVGTACVACLAATGLAVERAVACVTIAENGTADTWAPEAEAVVFLRDNHLRGRLLTWFDYGEVAIWHLAPRLRVSYDGRRETVYSDKVRHAHTAFYRHHHDGGYAKALNADFIWLPQRLPVVAPLKREGWTPIFSGSRSVVLAREPGEYAHPAPWAGPRCFPGP